MKRKLGMLLGVIVLLLSGCSLVEEVNSSLNYAAEATDLINDADQFANQLPLLAEQAIANPEGMAALRQELESMRDRLAAYGELVPPGFAEEVHAQLTGYNDRIRQEIDGYLQQIGANTIDLQALAEAPLVETIRNMSALLEQIAQLGQ
jgi:uncharacterized coiled-coil DUF342 family protein